MSAAVEAKRKFNERNIDAQAARPQKVPRFRAREKPVPKQKQSSSELPINLFANESVNADGSNLSQATPTASTTEEVGDINETGVGKTNAKTMATPKATLVETRNAFEELMTPKEKKLARSKPKSDAKALLQQPTGPSGPRLENPNLKGKGRARDALGVYVKNPKTIPKGLYLYDNDNFVVINDLYPKSTVHLLLLFKNLRNTIHPFHFLEDPDILAKTREEVKKMRQIVANELEKKFGKFSAQDKSKQQVLSGEVTLPEGADLPKGRDWSKEVMIGVHARPSMNHVHIHVLSRDRFSDWMTKRNHYQSFSTPFFVDLDDFPLPDDDPRWDSTQTNTYMRTDFVCWRCGKNNFKNFPKLKEHLAEEFREWRAE